MIVLSLSNFAFAVPITTLPPIPTVFDEITTGTESIVHNVAEFIAAYTDTGVDIIKLNNDIVFQSYIEENQISTFELTRNLKINGSGHSISLFADAYQFIHVKDGVRTLHLANITFNNIGIVNQGNIIYKDVYTDTDFILENVIVTGNVLNRFCHVIVG